jgi:two-component system KDP operon response regulator KdpE
VLVVDDDAPILRLVRAALQADGYTVTTATNGQEAVDAVEQDEPDIIILDLMMPVMDGQEALKRIRQSSSVPVIFLTARTSGADKVRSLDLGADDYVTKPFDPDELSARIAAVLRRTTAGGGVFAEPVIQYGDRLVIDLAARRVLVTGAEVQLSRTEWEVLHELAINVGRVIRHGELLARVWGPEFRDETYYLRTWVSRLRTKLGDLPAGRPVIITYPGIGYRLEAPDGGT